jgi:hypothetical protein
LYRKAFVQICTAKQELIKSVERGGIGGIPLNCYILLSLLIAHDLIASNHTCIGAIIYVFELQIQI